MKTSRRQFLESTVFAMPFILTGCHAGVARKFTANELVNVGQIGYGRIAHTMDVPRTLVWTDLCRFTAVSDLDSKRQDYGVKCIEEQYAKKGIRQKICAYSNYHELLADSSIDAVQLCIPDHQHALVAVDALLAGKHIWLQKPFAQTIQEGRAIANAAKLMNRVVQVGSWQRSVPQFHRACELVRNGRIGKVVKVEVGIGLDKSGGSCKVEEIPANLNYDAWLGPTPGPEMSPYNWTRVHTQNLKRIGDRPGWIQMAPYGWGMITNWGAHHLDITAWGLGADPVSVSGTCGWMDISNGRLWNVHTTYDLHYQVAGADVHAKDTYQMGVKFIGEKGDWIFCTRGAMKVTPSDPDQPVRPGQLGPLAASRNRLLEPIANPEVKLLTSKDHWRNWLEAIRAGDPSLSVTNAEGGHRSTAFCSLGRMCMELSRGKKNGASLNWCAKTETSGNAAADKMLVPFARGKYDLRESFRNSGFDYEKMIKPLA